MKNIYLTLAVLVLLVGCATTQETDTPKPTQPTEPKVETTPTKTETPPAEEPQQIINILFS